MSTILSKPSVVGSFPAETQEVLGWIAVYVDDILASGAGYLSKELMGANCQARLGFWVWSCGGQRRTG